MKTSSFKLALLASLAFSALAASGAASAQAAPKPEQQIKWRQSAYQVIAWNNGRVKANIEGQYNKDEVIKAANTIAALANSGLGSLFPAGTDTGKGWHYTAAKAELWAAGSKVAEYSANFSREANALAEVALLGDPAKTKEQFGKLGRTCKACHDDYKAKD
ncbi:cytochrome c [Paucibacter sp. B2R-40]|uniref:c-type cytochrome n=1 Tax=Paucibacter sp. B2R-40 TaxID=2893554 RepID=UPI0021E4AB55|nr:cytochrome c [Paucibacter sp. B2R-40]MCV2355677.1 cytochrome c [Paucibacter sp. B2R-40]